MVPTLPHLVKVIHMWQLLIMTLVLMGFLLYKNQDRAREFLLSFVSTEFRIVVQVATANLPRLCLSDS